MSLILEHLEYLMMRHDCVTLPGIGALIARYCPAQFAPESDCRLLPPSRQLAFNGRLEQSDGLLENSVSRQCGISFEAAARIVAEETASLRSQLIEFGELTLGKLGRLYVDSNSSVIFQATPASEWDYRFYGMLPLELTPLQTGITSIPQQVIAPAIKPYAGENAYTKDNEDDEDVKAPGRRGAARKIIGIAASLAIVVTLALSFFNPVKLSEEPEKASIAPVERVSEKMKENADGADRQHPDANLSIEDAGDIEGVSSDGDLSVGSESASTANYSSATTVSETTTNSEATTNSETTANYYIIVASFPDAAQAESYIARNPSRKLGVLNKDGRFRVYAATATTLSEAESLRAGSGQSDAWICSR